MRLHVLIALPLVVAAAACSIVVHSEDLTPCTDLTALGEKCGACGLSKIACASGEPACEEPAKGGTEQDDAHADGNTPFLGDSLALQINRTSSLALAWTPVTTLHPGIARISLYARRFGGFVCSPGGGDPLCECNASGCVPKSGYKDAAGPDTITVIAYRGTPDAPLGEIGRSELAITGLQCAQNDCDSQAQPMQFPIAANGALQFGDNAFVSFETTSALHFVTVNVTAAAPNPLHTWTRNPLKGEAWHLETDRSLAATPVRLDCPQ